MDDLNPIIYQLEERAAVLVSAAGTTRYLATATTAEHPETVYTATLALRRLSDELDATIHILANLTTELDQATEAPIQIPLNPGEFAASPAPGRAGVTVDLGEVQFTTTPDVLDQLIHELTQARSWITA